MKAFVAAASSVLCLVVWAKAAPQPPATAGEAQAAFASGDYAACLRQISSALASKEIKPGSPERYDLLVLRGECMLRLKQRAAASEAFDAAAAVMKSRRDVPRVATATATAVLIKASPGLQYKPKESGNGEGIDIVDPASRGEAFKALYAARAAEVGPAIAKATQDKSLVPIHALLPRAWELYTLEFAATGDAVRTVSDLKELGAHARALIGDELSRIIARLETLRGLATEPTLGGIGSNQAIGYRGLNSLERKELEEMAQYLTKIQRSIENARQMARALGDTGENWDGLLADCAVARDVAQQAYDRRY